MPEDILWELPHGNVKEFKEIEEVYHIIYNQCGNTMITEIKCTEKELRRHLIEIQNDVLTSSNFIFRDGQRHWNANIIIIKGGTIYKRKEVS